MIPSILLLTLLACSAFTVPSSWNHVLHERRRVTPPGWVKHSGMDPERLLPMKVAMKQSNIENLDDYLMRVSHPDSKGYGKHWTHQEITETFAPSQDTVKAVHDWLILAGVAKEQISKSQSMGWLNFNTTVKEAEKLLKTEYHLYKHEVTGMGHVACSAYHVPQHVQPHIDFITPTVHFDAQVALPSIPESDLKARNQEAAGIEPWKAPCPPKIAPRPKPILNDVADCSNNITPDCLRALYGIPAIPPWTKMHPNNTYGIVQYTPQSYLGSDLDMFFSNYSKDQVQTRPIFNSVDGGDISDTPDLDQNIESDLDLQYAMALVNPLNVSLYQVGDLIETDYTSFNNFLDSIDASYCLTEDLSNNTTNPTIDAIYPDPLPGGYSGPANCGGYAAAKVISTSYSYNEHDLTPAYEIRQCNEYGKLGLAGTTFLYCSSDYGVAGSGGKCIDPTTGLANDGTSGLFAPSFPSTCPYVLSVGATQIKMNASVSEPEIACATKISSGGGFSNVFQLPSYQTEAVGEWFKKYPTGYGSDRFNDSGNARGYPDVSANGAMFVVALDGTYDYHLYGTSASTPTFGSVIALINEARMQVGKGSVGFVSEFLFLLCCVW
jgi:tripeptidyl-peptidase-1